MSTVRDILNGKDDNAVVTIRPEQTVAEAAGVLHAHRIGAALVSSQGKIAGILSERDIVRGIAKSGCGCLDEPVSSLMTRLLVTCGPDDDLPSLMELMTDRRVRHIPVMAEGRLQGIVSIGDVVKSRIAEIEFESAEMRRYIATG
ncbi:MAG: CBS domain-containing protein [Alphaproteobacteria bacterium]